MICRICNIDKHETLFSPQWNKTQQRYYLNKRCNECRNRVEREKRWAKFGKPIKRVKKPQISPVIKKPKGRPKMDLGPRYEAPKRLFECIEMDKRYKFCTKCNQIKELDEFKGPKRTKLYSYCFPCISISEKIKRKKENDENGGTISYFPTPNEYKTEFQKKAVFDIMLSLGWKFNEGIWYKDGIKTDKGVFINIKPRIKEEETITSKNTGRNNRIKDLMKPVQAKLKELRKDGYTYTEIASMYGVSKKVIENWTKK